ncbi:FAD binding domain protein [Stachybotrys elegans]|uniref:FAD binding domain protein n=1 Tax=Stachybotrys elegans TaxID=80388 RepID=A0A8K0SG84_9HYPO|nr:FAD binding domain protein [Stachybotrys elegans]
MGYPDPPFRVIVVGAGVAGLTASHCLEKAGIDHVVLERRAEIAPPEGASIAIYPNGSRILEQIDCLEAAEAACVPMDRWICRRPGGKQIWNTGFFDFVKENHGRDILLLERRNFLRILYDCLPNKSRVRLNAGVAGIKQSSSGVEVALSDGTVEVGDLVLGCDGVHSRTRGFMWDHANKTAVGTITAKEKKAMKTMWKCLVGTGPPAPELGERDMTVTHDNRYSFLALTQPDRVFWFVFFHQDKTTTWPHRDRYTDQDAEALAATVADHPVSESILFGELWKKRDRGQLIAIEEGVLDHWFHGRIALAGDAVHKVTPNIALGGNTAMESVVVLCNHIKRMVTAQQGAKPSPATLEKTLMGYQTERHARAKEIMELSGLITKVQAWDTPLHKFMATWALPLQPDRTVPDQLGEIIRGAPKLEFVEIDGFAKGRLPWKDEEEAAGVSGVEKPLSGFTTLVQASSAAMAIVFVVYLAQLFPIVVLQ